MVAHGRRAIGAMLAIGAMVAMFVAPMGHARRRAHGRRAQLRYAWLVPWFLPAIAATATAALARKIVARYWHGVAAQHAQADPPGFRTVARFDAERPRDVLRAIAIELGYDVAGIEVTTDAIRAPADGAVIDLVRLRTGPAMTVELTRAWTGAYLGTHARQLLHRMHTALSKHAREVTWFARQDRAFAAPFTEPCDETSLATATVTP